MADLKVFIGYDPREDIAWQVCRHSILRHASQPVEVVPIRQTQLRVAGLYTRGLDAASTEFSLTRFLTPHLGAHGGHTLFADCDFLFTRDVFELLAFADPETAVHVIKHDYVPRRARKMDGQVQAAYPRKNWSSLMLFNGAHAAVRGLTPKVVNTAMPQHLHRFEWVDDAAIGSLPPTWNFLVGEYEPVGEVPAAVHFTNGGPWFEGCGDVDYAGLWLAERAMLEV